MANSNKNLVITPNIGSANDPNIVFSGADASTAAQNITLTAYPTNGGTLSFDGSAGQLFSLTNSMSGTIFSANDVSGIPSLEILDTGLVKIAQYSGNILLGTSTDTGLAKLQIVGSVSLTGSILHSPTGRSIYGPNPTWSSYLYLGGDGVNGITRTASIASIVTTNGNVHIDSGSDKSIYLNYYSGTGGIQFGNGTSAGVTATLSAGGIFTSTADVRAPIFYDSNDTAYYLNPNATSNLNAATFAGTVTAASAAPEIVMIASGGNPILRFGDTTGTVNNRNWKLTSNNSANGDFLIMRSLTTGATAGTVALGFDRDGAATFAGNLSITGERFRVTNESTVLDVSTTTAAGGFVRSYSNKVSILNAAGAAQGVFSSTGLAVTGAVSGARGVFSDSSGSGSAIIEAYSTVATNGTTAIIRQTTGGGNGNQDIGLLVDIQGAADTDRIANFRYYNGSTYTSRMAIMRGGNVGIGTISPDAMLHAVGGIAMSGGWNRTMTLEATYPCLVFKSNASKWAAIQYDYSSALNFRVGATSNDVTGSGVNALSIAAVTGAATFGSTVSATNLSGTNTGDQTNISGNAATATNVAYSGLTGTVPTWNQNTTGSAASCTGNAATATYAGYLPTAYVSGQQLNPQTYFSMGTGLKVAMTAVAGIWSDTLWINGYAGGDVKQMCALHTQRNGTPRMYISNQASDATAYGTLYEFLTAYNYTSYSMPAGSSATNSVDVRAPIFYDSNDTSYYVNPNSFSQLSYANLNASPSGRTLSLGGDQLDRVTNDSARSSLVINALYYPHLYINATSNANNANHGAVFSMSGNLTAGGYRRWGMGIANTNPDCFSWGYYDNEINPHYGVGGTFGYTTTNSKMWLNTSGSLWAVGDMRAPVFYDSNNTAYYIDPNGGGSNVFGEFKVNQNGAAGIQLISTTGTQSLWIRTGYSGAPTPSVSATNVQFQSSGSSSGSFNFWSGNTLALTITGDYAEGAGSLRAPIFYDSNNTAYYLDPASTGNSLLVAGRVGIGDLNPSARGLSLTTASDVGMQITMTRATGTNYGWLGGPSGAATTNIGMQPEASGATNNYSIRIPGPSVGANNYAIYADSGAQLYFGGNVGIGTTAPQRKLDILGGDIMVRSTSDTGTSVVNFGSTTYYPRASIRSTGLASPVGDANLSFWTRSSGSEYERITILNTGNVGIGTTGPSVKLAVVGSATIGSVYNTAAGTNAVSFGEATNASGVNSFAIGYYSTASNYHSFAAGYSSTASGHTGIAIGYLATAGGNGNSPIAIGRFVTANGENMVLGRGFDASNPLVNTGTNSIMMGAGSNLPTLYIGAASGVGTTGNVGIGTTTPGSKLSVAQDMSMGADLVDNTAQMVIQGTTTPGKKLMLGYDTNGNGFGFIKAGNLGVAWTNLALQPNSGSVSIGATSAVYKLDVNGVAYASSDFRAPIFYDSNNTAYYVDPASSSELSSFTAATYTRMDETSRKFNRQTHSADTNYWTGTRGWAATFTWDTAWSYGFGGFDIWGSSTGHPQGSGYVHAQGIQSGLHYATSDSVNAYGWQLVGGDGASSRLWMRGKWGSATTAWYELAMYDRNVGTGNLYANVFYDSANTGYYLDPAATSYITSLTVTNTISGSVNGTAAALLTGSSYQVNSFGVGTAASGTAGEIRATNNITAYYSDDRLKTKLGLISDPIEKVKSLSGFYFEANETAVALGYTKQREVGVSAQEVQAILPEIIAPAPIDAQYMTVRYEKLIPLLIEAIKAQQVQIEELKAHITIIQQNLNNK